MNLQNIRIAGRNWTGFASSNPVMRAATFATDMPLRLFPALCGDIYLVAEKPLA
jgi:hypothetical protein